MERNKSVLKNIKAISKIIVLIAFLFIVKADIVEKKTLYIMKGEHMSDSVLTKKAIATALKELTATKPFDKISISDITKSCGLNRQTFYYHFQDKYELLSWIYYTEGFSVVTHDISFENWNEKILAFLVVLKNNKVFYCNTIKSAERDFIEYLLQITTALFEEAIHVLDTKNKLKPEQQKFFSQFYAYGICGIITAWIHAGMKETPEEVAHNLKVLATNSEQLAYKIYTGEIGFFNTSGTSGQATP